MAPRETTLTVGAQVVTLPTVLGGPTGTCSRAMSVASMTEAVIAPSAVATPMVEETVAACSTLSLPSGCPAVASPAQSAKASGVAARKATEASALSRCWWYTWTEGAPRKYAPPAK